MLLSLPACEASDDVVIITVTIINYTFDSITGKKPIILDVETDFYESFRK